jgi:2-hydroxychromene-2-carboxylate isomerase
MTTVIDYYIAPQSPYCYFGHARIYALAKMYDCEIRLMPMDLGGKVFPVSGGMPLGQRPVQRQNYRLAELTRWASYLGVPFNLKPQFFPVPGDEASLAIIRCQQLFGTDSAMGFTQEVLAGVWANQQNINDMAQLEGLAHKAGLSADQADQVMSTRQQAQAQYEANSQAAIEAGVFGAPWFVIDGEPFWGQDRIDFVERKLIALKG